MPTLCSGPRLRGYLYRIPWAAERRCIAEIQVVELFDRQLLEQRGCEHIEALRDFCLLGADYLRSQQSPSGVVTGDAKLQRHRPGIVGFVIVRFCLDCQRVKARFPRFGVADPRARNRKVENLQALRANVPANSRSLSRHTAFSPATRPCL